MDMEPKEQVEEFSSDAEFDDEGETDSSSDIDSKLEEDDVFDVEFFKCYSALKKKDSKIYDENVKFFTERDEGSDSDVDKKPDGGDTEPRSLLGLNSKKSNAPKMTLLDHQLALADGDIEEPELSRTAKIDLTEPVSKSFYDKELEEIKKSIEKVSENVDSESDDDLLIVKSKDGDQPVKSKSKKAISSILDKLEGVEDEDITHLKQVWSDPDNLTKEERFLRDYILNKRYLPNNDDDSENDDDEGGFFSKNLEGLPDNEVEAGPSKKSDRQVPAHHSDEKEFDKLVRIPRNSTKTIRDMVEKREKQEKRQKKLEKEKKKKKSLKDADCEDIVGDLPTRFHYRETEPNDYGLSAEELLMATDEELDQWINIKEAIAYKSREEELAEKKRFEHKRNDIELKKKIFKSIYGDKSEPNEAPESPNKSKKKRKRNSESSNVDTTEQVEEVSESVGGEEEVQESNRKKKKKMKRRGLNHKKFAKTGVAPDRLLAYGLSKTKLKKSKLL